MKDGLLLTFVVHHGAMDMTGQGVLTDLLAEACCGEEFTGEEVAIGKVDRRTIIPVLDTDKSLPRAFFTPARLVNEG